MDDGCTVIDDESLLENESGKGDKSGDELEVLDDSDDGVLIEAIQGTDNTGEVPEGTAELLPLEKAKSRVWNYFGFPASSGEYVEKDKRLRKEVFCKICKHSLSYKGNTTNMFVHLQYNHAPEYNELVSSSSKSTECSKPKKIPKGQLSIKESFGKLQPLSRSCPRWKSLTNAVCQFLAQDLVPIDTVNDAGFRRMLNVFEPRYVLPDRTTFSRHYLPDLYQKERAKVTEQIALGLKYFAITTDCWSSRANHSFMSLTVHYISPEWDLKSHMLETGEITVEHTAINLSDYLKESLDRWKLPSTEISAVVTDNASNITAAINKLELQHFGCFSHTLQLGVQKAISLSDVSRALSRVRRLVSHFHSSVKSTNILRQKQRDLRHNQHKLIQVQTIS